jgi:hypothetical protein
LGDKLPLSLGEGSAFCFMADPNEPKKETVRISLPPQSTPPPSLAVEKESTRIILPNRPPARSAAADAPAADLRPPSSTPVRPPAARPTESVPPAGLKAPLPPAPPKPVFPPISGLVGNQGAAQPGFRKETARVTNSPTKATVKLGTMQPAGSVPSPIIRGGLPAVAKPPPRGLVEAVPTQLCWALLAISGLALLTQLWTYLS